jgi:hypothetical protein
MTEQLVREFTKHALASGLAREKVAALISKAAEIQSRRPQNIKTAEANLNEIVSSLLSEAGFDKNASSIAYTHGILKEALDNRISPEATIKVAKLALTKTRENLELATKLAEISRDPGLAEYAESFIKAATDHGYSQEDATRYVVGLIENEKRAVAGGPAGMGAVGQPGGAGQGSMGMFKQPMPDPSQGGLGGPGGPPGGAPGMGGAGGPPGMGDQGGMGGLEALLGQGGQGAPGGEQIDPQMLQQLLAIISGGQGAGQSPAAGLAQ